MIPIICYLFSMLAFGLFIYCFFFTQDVEIRNQAIYWFFTSVVVFFLPSVKQFKYKDLEVIFKEELKKVKDSVDQKTHAIKEAYLAVYKKIYPMQQDVFKKLSKNDVEGALVTVNEALQTLDVLNINFPNDPNVQSNRAYMLKNHAIIMKRLHQPEEFSKSLDEAKKMFQSILAQNQKDAGAWNGLGNVYLLKGDLETALLYIDKAIDIQPDYEAAKHDRNLVLSMINKQKNK